MLLFYQRIWIFFLKEFFLSSLKPFHIFFFFGIVHTVYRYLTENTVLVFMS